MLFHNLVLVGTGSKDPSASASDWIYMRDTGPTCLDAGGTLEWEYVLMPFEQQKQFYGNAFKLGHPVIEYSPVTVTGGMFISSFQLSKNQKPLEVWVESFEEGTIQRIDLTDRLKQSEGGFQLDIRMIEPGERKLGIVLENGKTDCVVFNAIEPVKEIIEARVDYICRNGEFRCINGELVKTEDRYEVTSYAAYPREFHFYQANTSYLAAPGDEVRTVIFENGKFHIPSQTAPKIN